MNKVKKISLLWNKYKTFGILIAYLQVFSAIIKYVVYTDRLGQSKIVKKLFSTVITLKDYQVQKWIQKNFKSTLSVVETKNKRIDQENNFIWTMWLQGIDKMPPIVRLCNLSVEKHRGNATHIILTQENILDYIDIPEFILEKWKDGVINNAHFSDYVRVSILDKYGGIWLDSTVLLVAPFPEYVFNDFAQYHAKGLNSFKNDFLYFEIRNWESYFLVRSGDTNLYLFLKKALEEYWEKYDYAIDYLFLNHLAFLARTKSKKIQEEFNIIPDNNVEAENLYPNIEKNINSVEFEKFIHDNETIVYKLNHRHELQSTNQYGQTIFGYLLNEYM